MEPLMQKYRLATQPANREMSSQKTAQETSRKALEQIQQKQMDKAYNFARVMAGMSKSV